MFLSKVEMQNNIIIHDVGLRDGLQSIDIIIETNKKIEWLEKLIDAGVRHIQVGSFVNPKVLPQMADTDELFRIINQRSDLPEDLVLTALILNEKGMERALDSNIGKILMGVSASETHSLKNTKMSVDEATNRIISIAKECIAAGRLVQVSIQSAFGCGFEGKIPQEKVLKIIEQYLNNGLTTISLADTAGHANPKQVKEIFTNIKNMDESVELACHFHNTYGMGLINIQTAIDCGVRYVETSFAGLGGCPFTKVPAGNVATEDFVHFLWREKYKLNIDLDKLIELAKDVEQYLGYKLPGYVYKTGKINWN